MWVCECLRVWVQEWLMAGLVSKPHIRGLVEKRCGFKKYLTYGSFKGLQNGLRFLF